MEQPIVSDKQKKNTIDSMSFDSNLMSLQSKYQNVFWTFLAIGTVLFTITNIKK